MSSALKTYWPGAGLGVAYNASTFALNQTTDTVDWLFKARIADTITHFGFLPTAKNGTGVTWRVSLQGVGLGVPDGTIKGGGSPASKTFTNAALTAGTYAWIALDNSYACTGGENLAWVLDYSAGSPSSGSEDLTVAHANALSAVWTFPFSSTTDAGSRTRTSGNMPAFAYKSATRVYGFPIEAAYSQAWNSGSSPAIWGQKFTIPAAWTDTYQVIGVRLLLQTPSTTVDNAATLRLYSDTTILQDVAVQGANTAATASARWIEWTFDESTLSSLTAGNSYYVALVPGTTNTWTWRGWSVNSSADFGAWAGGTNMNAASFNGSAWTDVAASRFVCDLILEDITEAAAGGGGFSPIGLGSSVIRGAA